MGVIATTVVVLGGIGIIAAAVLYFVAKTFHVYENPKIAEIEELLPGANCGGCGFSGCHAFAKGCAETDSLDKFNCTGAGPDIMKKISAIVGLESKPHAKRIAVLKCNGSCSIRPVVNEYDGIRSCALESSLYQGETACVYGCLGCGDCVAKCIFDAISIDPATHLPKVDIAKCTGCGQCATACPRSLIDIVELKPGQPLTVVACSNKDKGAVAMKVCEVSCIGCGKCKRVCESDAVTIENLLAHINTEACTACGKCIADCPRHAIISIDTESVCPTVVSGSRRPAKLTIAGADLKEKVEA